jgi:hypothetical protein
MGILGFAFQPREPQWKVLDLKFLKAELPVLEGFSNMMKSLNGASSAIDMTMETTVSASNPNLIGAHALPGVFDISYKNDTIGRARTKSLTIGPMATIVIKVAVAVNEIPADLGIDMLSEMQNHNMELPILVTGTVIAEVGMLKVRTTIKCDLKTDCSKLPAETKFTYKKCTYEYDLPEPAALAAAEARARREAVESVATPT